MFLSQHTVLSFWGYGLFILETLVALGIIAAVGYGVVWWTQTKAGGRGRGARMRVLERLPLTHKRALHLVEVDGRTFLIGSTEQAVHLLVSLDGVDKTEPDSTTPEIGP